MQRNHSVWQCIVCVRGRVHEIEIDIVHICVHKIREQDTHTYTTHLHYAHNWHASGKDRSIKCK